MKVLLGLLLFSAVLGIFLSVSSASQMAATSECIDPSTVDALLRSGNWTRLGSGYETGAKVTNLPDQGGGFFYVNMPVTQVDKQNVSYYQGAQVPAGGEATAWFDRPIGPCAGPTPIGCIDSSTVDVILGREKWNRFSDQNTGVLAIDLPDRNGGFFVVKAPVVKVDKQGISYLQGSLVPAGGMATVWFDRPICSDTPVTPAPTLTTTLWQADNLADLQQFMTITVELYCNADITDVKNDILFVEDPPVIELVANVKRRPGVYVNALTHRSVFTETLSDEFQKSQIYARTWNAWGEFKKGPETGIQNNGISFQLVDNNIEYPALIQWILNPDDNDYGWVRLRTLTGPNGDKRLHYIGDDNDWHSWNIETRYDSSTGDRTITHVTIDGMKYRVNVPMPIVPDKGWSFSFALLLELTNHYITCDSNLTYVGSMYYRNMGVGYSIPIRSYLPLIVKGELGQAIRLVGVGK